MLYTVPFGVATGIKVFDLYFVTTLQARYKTVFPSPRVILISSVQVFGIFISEITYRKIPIISPGLIFVKKAILLSLFSGELIFGGAYNWKEFCVSKWVGLDNKTA